MDSLASIGRYWASPQFYLTLIVAMGFIGFGLYMIITKKQETIPGIPSSQNEPPSIIGAVLITYGIGMFFFGWIRRKLIRSNPTVAAISGALDISTLLKG